MNSGKNMLGRAKEYDEKVANEKKRAKRKPLIITITTAVIVGLIIGGVMIYEQTKSSYKDTTKMADEEVVEYVDGFSSDEYAKFLTTVSTDEADRIMKLYNAARFSTLDDGDTFEDAN